MHYFVLWERDENFEFFLSYIFAEKAMKGIPEGKKVTTKQGNKYLSQYRKERWKS